MRSKFQDVTKAIGKALAMAEKLDATEEDDVYRAIARAAILAMRKPSEAMIVLGAAVFDCPSVDLGGPSQQRRRKIALRIYQTMIDAALAAEVRE